MRNKETIIVNSLSEYTSEVTGIRERMLQDGESETLFFRGQCNSVWDIRPSIFRESLVSVESRIIKTAKSRVPSEFRECTSPFEELTKLQHYGLPTRLLDLTRNPLVALYFACCSSEIVVDNEGVENYSDGVVYICSGYEESTDSFNSTILAKIAQIDFDGETTLKLLKDKLGLTEELPAEAFIKILQGSAFVMPSYNNSRIIRQSGAFLITGSINICQDDEDIWNSVVSKCVRNLNEAIDVKRIIIPNEIKEDILDELDLFNINESSLFPELEHQMSHVKRVGSKWVMEDCSPFIKYEHRRLVGDSDVQQKEMAIDENIIDVVVSSKMADEGIQSQVKSVIKEVVAYPDWNIKGSTRNELLKKIKRILVQNGIEGPEMLAQVIVKELINNI
ncbi:MAG: FRG domain-containing protein [Bacteroidales bacterium]|nr:FRG domain-containing protein [Bacteroidales bacterium]